MQAVGPVAVASLCSWFLERRTPDFQITCMIFGVCMQAVGPVAVTSLLLGSGLKDTISSDVQADPNNPADPAAQMEYNMAAIQVIICSQQCLPKRLQF